MTNRLDILLLVPSPTSDAYLTDPLLRQTYGPAGIKILAAASELEDFVGRSLAVNGSVYANNMTMQRTLTAIALATNLEHEGLQWAAIDPGSQQLSYWRKRLLHHQARRPRCVAISTTYFVTAHWLEGLIRLVRSVCPQATVLAGGYMYGTASREFLSLSADIMCVGEGELRLPQIVKALRDDTPLAEITGLYIRRADGSLQHTGHTEPLELARLPLPDWSLATRIDPPVEPERDRIGLGVETQRGCVFKCQFCTFRTLTVPNVLDPEQAVEMIFNTRTFRHGHIFLADATATFPRERWNEILIRLAERGGSPHPIWAFARVTDLNPQNVALMVRANVGATFIGQESGDQSILTAMRKGTNVNHVKPAVASLAGSGIHTTFGFIHGFPSETAQTMQATRNLICTLNDGFENEPVVYQYTLTPFAPQDLASVASQQSLERVPAKVAIEETLTTFVASARVPHAPASNYIGFAAADSQPDILPGASPLELFRWTKTLQHGIAIFLERDLDGKRVDLTELKQVREQLVRPMPPAKRGERAVPARLARMARTRALHLLHRELDGEDGNGAGLLTRLLLAGSAFRDSRSVGDAWSAWRMMAEQETKSAANGAQIEELARDLVTDALQSPQRRLADGQARARLGIAAKPS